VSAIDEIIARRLIKKQLMRGNKSTVQPHASPHWQVEGTA